MPKCLKEMWPHTKEQRNRVAFVCCVDALKSGHVSVLSNSAVML